MTTCPTPSTKTIRSKIRRLRQDLSPQVQQLSAKQLFNRLVQSPKVKAAQHIGIFLSNDGEINTIEFIQWCWTMHKNVYLPVIHPHKKGHLRFFEYHHNSEMSENKFGILEPKTKDLQACHLEKLDLIFTPLVAFDQLGNRVGMGGGYYDRLLCPWFKNQQGPYPIGLAHDCQRVEKLPTQEWDVPLPEIITPSEHHHWI